MSLAILCPGQGGQNREMFASVTGVPPAEAVLDCARELLAQAPQALATAGDAMFRNRVAQPLVCAAMLARWEAIRERLPSPAMVLGYSVGELAAHAIAGTFTIEDCLYLSGRRAAAMDAASPPESGLTAILGLNRDQVDTLCTQHASAIAIVNGETHYVVGGRAADLDALEHATRALGARTRRLNVSVPAHTHWLTGATETFAQELVSVKLRASSIPVLAGIDGHAVRDAIGAKETLAAQISRTIQWSQCVTQAVERGASVFLELGPGSALVRIVRELYPEYPVRSLDEFATLDGALTWVGRMLDR